MGLSFNILNLFYLMLISSNLIGQLAGDNI